MRKILGPMAILAKRQRATPQGGGVLRGEPLEGPRLASLGSVDQFMFIVFGRVHCTGDSHFGAERFTRRRHFLANFRCISRVVGSVAP